MNTNATVKRLRTLYVAAAKSHVDLLLLATTDGATRVHAEKAEREIADAKDAITRALAIMMSLPKPAPKQAKRTRKVASEGSRR